MQYKSECLDDDEIPDKELNALAEQGWRLVSATPFAEVDTDNHGYNYKTRKIRYVMEKRDKRKSSHWPIRLPKSGLILSLCGAKRGLNQDKPAIFAKIPDGVTCGSCRKIMIKDCII
jgi:hypothetical protein